VPGTVFTSPIRFGGRVAPSRTLVMLMNRSAHVSNHHYVKSRQLSKHAFARRHKPYETFMHTKS
jgi:hypothetical protein